jgi:succinate dehydrogenase / fumarate reductase, flavoprotein subunit
VPSFINQLSCMIELSKIITKGALLRDEFRGAHFKPEFDLHQPKNFDPYEYIDYMERKENKDELPVYPEGHLEYMQKFEENNKKWLKSTIAEYKNNEPEISYEDIDTSILTPRPRKYD